MARTLSNLKAQLQRRIRDKTDGTIETADQTDLFNRGIDKLKSFHEFPGTKQRAEINVFDGVNEYAVPSGYKSAIDFRTSDNDSEFYKRTSREFWQDVNSEFNLYSDDNYNETKLLLIDRSVNNGNIQIHNCDTISDNGTWAVDAATDATNLTADEIEYKAGSASLNFDIDVSLTATDTAAIANSTMTAVDLSDHEDQSRIFAWVYIPDVTYITTLTMRWGSDASNYWSADATTAHNGMDFKNGWNRVSFAWDGATETGSPDSENVDYLYFLITFTSSQTDDTDFRLDDVRSLMPEKLTLNYYSENFVKDTDGEYQAEFEDDDDVSILEDHEDEMLLYAALEEAFEILREFDDAARARTKFVEFFNQISNDKPSEKTKSTDRYVFFG